MSRGRNTKINSEKYITLKEAALISGYSADYVGQLIRKGKLPGKQVYHTVAWMTTEHALREYMGSSHKEPRLTGRTNLSLMEKIRDFKDEFLMQMKLAPLVRASVYVLVIASVSFALLLFYVFSVTVDQRIQQRAVSNLETSLSEFISEQ